MESVKLRLLVIVAVIVTVSCGSQPQPTEQPLPPPEIVIEDELPAQVEEFDPGNVSQDLYNLTKVDVQHFIEDLNKIISSGNYNSWKDALSDEYFAMISSPGYLHQVSEQPAMKTQKIVLRTAEDFFKHVVMPSRANTRVDDIDIEFISENRVKAFTVSASRANEEQRLRLYDLEHFENSWKIIN